MTIQFNTDNNIIGSEELRAPLEQMINDSLGRFDEHITRLEAHFSDENNSKKGPDEKRCMLEARMQGRQPIAVTNYGDNLQLALKGALDKMKISLDSTLERLRNY